MKGVFNVKNKKEIKLNSRAPKGTNPGELKKLAEVIRFIRAYTYTSQQEFAEMCGVCPHTVALWEQGKVLPSPKHADKIHQVAQLVFVSGYNTQTFRQTYATVSMLPKE